MNSYKYQSKIGDIYIQADENWLYKISYSPLEETNTNAIIDETIKQLDEYFSYKRQIFDLPLCMKGTEFQKQVWNELLKIPYSQIRTYKDIATAINNPKAIRAVGNANNKNPIAIIIPCHRVIGANGDLIGYAGGLDKKQKLLDLEKMWKIAGKLSY